MISSETVALMYRPLRVVAAALCASAALTQPGSAQGLPYALFERYVESLRQQTGIPGMSAALVKDGEIEWERGFGQQDIERSIAASPGTPYSVGGLTETLSAALLGECAERGTLNIDEVMTRWVADFPAESATVRRVLAHAATGVFRFDPSQFALLSAVGQACHDRPFRVAMADDILERFAMTASIPGHDLGRQGNPARESFDAARLDRYDAVLARTAVPYKVDRNGRATRSDIAPHALDAASGLVSTVRDLARFDAALDAGALLRPSTLAIAWTPAAFGAEPLPTGLGWFVQTYQDEKFIWHYSASTDGESALILKVPARRLTLIMLANSNGLSAGANLDQGDVTTSPFVKIFLRLFL
jgi:CubicO group peptidase (beta-lactamase class C family)